MTKVDASGALRKMREIGGWLRETAVPAALEAARDAAIISALERAPSMDEEYRELNAPAGGEPFIPRAGGRSADPEDYGRVRFEKPEETYIESLVPNPANMKLEGSRFSFGNIAFLSENTYFSYTNATKGDERKSREGKTYGPYRVNDYFMRFEAGASGDFVVSPNPEHGSGTHYLTPGSAKETFTRQMNKSIKPRLMFLSPDLEVAVRSAMAQRLREFTH